MKTVTSKITRRETLSPADEYLEYTRYYDNPKLAYRSGRLVHVKPPSAVVMCFIKYRVIRREKDGYHVYSEKGKHLGGPYSLDRAKKRLREIEYFKHNK